MRLRKLTLQNWRNVALASVARATAGVVGQALADHRHRTLEEGQMRRDGFSFGARHRQREGYRQLLDQRAQALPAVVLPEHVIDRAQIHG